MEKLINFLILLLIITGCSDSKVNSTNELILSVAKSQDDIKNEEKSKKDRLELVKIGNDSPIGNILTKDSSSISTDKFKGKLLVIDFWATWCSPCLKEIPKFKELETKYENPQVEFITVSINDEFKYWQNYIKENNWKTDNYWYGVKENEPFFSYTYSEVERDSVKMILVALPKYVIISPEGKILNNNASKPSNPDFERELQSRIKEYSIL